MPARLVIRCYTDTDQVEWELINKNDSIEEAPTQSNLAEIPIVNANTQRLIFVPTAEVLLTHATLPKASRARLIQAVPYSLEDDLAASIEDLHFALGDWEENKVHVAIVEKQLMDQWIQNFKAAGISPDIILPDAFALPLYNHSWTIAIEPNISLLRTGKRNGLAVDTDNLEIVVRALLDEAGKNRPEKIFILNYADINIEALHKFTIDIEEDKHPKSLLSLITHKPSELPNLNLLQGPYKSKHKTTKMEKRWRLAAFIGIAWLSILLLGHIGQTIYFKIEQTRLTKQITLLYQQVFPGSIVDDSPKLTLEKELRQLMQASSGSPFLRLLAKAGQPLVNNKNITVSKMKYQNNQLILNVEASSFQVLEQLEKNMRSRGSSVKESNVISKGKRVTAVLTIK